MRADSLAYLSLEGMKTAVSDRGNFCAACFDEDYPIPPTRDSGQKQLFELAGRGTTQSSSVK